MKYQNTAKITACLALGLHGIALAGPAPAPIEEAPATNNGDWCDWLQNKPGIVYKNKENPFIQELQFEGRFQYQYGIVDGNDVNGADFDEDYEEVRRLRLGVKSKFLQYFSLKFQVNLADDDRPSGGNLGLGYQDIDEAYLRFNLNKALADGGINTGLDELSLTYGRQKFLFSTEAHLSSNKLLTVERSALSNRVYGSFRPTGLTVDAAKGPWAVAASFYSSTEDGSANEELNGFQDSESYLLNVAYQANDNLLLRLDTVYNDADPSEEDSVIAYQWAVGLGAEYETEKWGFIADLIYGDNGGSDFQSNPERQGDFYGFQMTPYVWLLKDRLQLVGQYQWQGSDGAQGVRINSRYGRSEVDPSVDLGDGGRGDSHHSVYGGLNYFICGHNAKIQAGIEYQTINSDGPGDLDTLTYVFAWRSFF